MTQAPDDSKAIYLRLLRHVVPYWRVFAVGTVMMIVLGLTEPAFPAILEMVVSSFEENTLGAVPMHAALFLGVFLVRGLSSFPVRVRARIGGGAPRPRSPPGHVRPADAHPGACL